MKSLGRERAPIGRRFVVLVLTACLISSCRRETESTPRPALVEAPYPITVNGLKGAAAGEPQFIGFQNLLVKGKKPVGLLRADVLGVPNGLVIDQVWATRASENPLPGGGWIGGTNLQDKVVRLRPFLRPINGVVLNPDKEFCPPAGTPGICRPDWEDWYLLIESHITRPGEFQTKAFRITYEVEKRRMQTTFDFAIKITSGPDLNL